MTTYVVYGDLLFLTNFILDLALLIAVKRFGNFPGPLWRVFLAAAFGAMIGVISLSARWMVLRTIFGKVIVSFLIVSLAFPAKGSRLITAFIYFYLIGFAMAGGVMALTWLVHDTSWQNSQLPYTALGLGAALLLALAFSYWGASYVKKNLRRSVMTEPLEIVLGGRKTSLPALMDTGNELLDPVTGRPVIIVEYHAVEEILPKDFRQAWLHWGHSDVTKIFTMAEEKNFGLSLRLVPFSSIGKRNGMLLGFCPQCIILPQRKHAVIRQAVVCLYDGAIGSREDCRGIVNPAILDMV